MIVPMSFSPDQYPASKPGFATGISVYFTEFISIQTGFLLERGKPRITMGSEIKLDDVSFIVNYSLDLTTQFGSPDKFSVQARLNLGDQGRGEIQDRVDSLYREALLAFAKGELAKALNLCEEAVALDPGFDPARETIKTLKRTLELQDELEVLRILEPEDEEIIGDADEGLF